jgi:outer membrane receptor for ferrienterochelin and colicins
MLRYPVLMLFLLFAQNLMAQTDSSKMMEEVVVSGSLKPMRRSESVVPVELISYKFFQKNPTPSLFEAVGLLNGVQSQINCNVCNTGDIHINGMEGAYTMILIDGMPIVSSLSTVYGLSGIPNSMIDRIEVVKGPASSLYGSEAMGGIINVITKNASLAPKLSVDVMATSWQEYNADIAGKFSIGKNVQSLAGLNYYRFQKPIDKNNDGFTDLTLQNRLSLFNKWNRQRKEGRIASLGLRYVNEDRWGGQTNWTQSFRGGDSIYAEQVGTKRWEIIGQYQLPFKEKIMTQISYNWHDQNSVYGTTPYIALQQVAFAQAYWDKQLGRSHSFLLGSSIRYTHYDDNSPATASPDGKNNAPSKIILPGVFIQDEWTLNLKTKLLSGYRLDYNQNHGLVHSPRLAVKYTPNYTHTFRASAGTGFRVVNLFTEDHAALSGARSVLITEALKPEKSYNSNLNYLLRLASGSGPMSIDVTGFYSYFTNKIVGDFDSDPQKIIYKNLNGHAVSRGISINVDKSFTFPLKITLGLSYMNVLLHQQDSNGQLQSIQQLHAPTWSGNCIASYTPHKKWIIDFIAKWTGPMRLPILAHDFRPEYSPWFCIANLQLTYKVNKQIEIYMGVKNLLNFVPQNPIMRPFDPFDKNINDPLSNPKGYTFDPSYNYASLQGVRGFLGLRYSL